MSETVSRGACVLQAKGVQNLAQTLVVTLPSLMHVSFLLMIFFFMYAVLGVQLFYNVKLQGVLSRQANFSNFGMALYAITSTPLSILDAPSVSTGHPSGLH